jgi:putative restriction endonuclease
MAKGVFLFREDSRYDDRPWEVYQFPRPYLSRASQMVGDWVIFLEPAKAGKKGYHAVAKVTEIVPDPRITDMYLAIIDPTTYLDFDRSVAFQIDGAYPERSVLNEMGKVSGRAQAAVRTIPDADFNRIIAMGLDTQEPLLPRVDDPLALSLVQDQQTPFVYEEDKAKVLTLRTVRDRIFRSKVIKAYDRRCALTGFKFINGGGRAEVEAAHIKSVADKGPDIVANGLALSGTIHWMFDRGLISLGDDRRILLSNHINDVDGVRKILNGDGYAILPELEAERPDPRFLAWHREKCFKGIALTS